MRTGRGRVGMALMGVAGAAMAIALSTQGCGADVPADQRCRQSENPYQCCEALASRARAAAQEPARCDSVAQCSVAYGAGTGCEGCATLFGCAGVAVANTGPSAELAEAYDDMIANGCEAILQFPKYYDEPGGQPACTSGVCTLNLPSCFGEPPPDAAPDANPDAAPDANPDAAPDAASGP